MQEVCGVGVCGVEVEVCVMVWRCRCVLWRCRCLLCGVEV